MGHGSAIDVVHLVQEDPGCEIGEFVVNEVSLAIQVAYLDASWSFDHASNAGEGETVLPVVALGLCLGVQSGVHDDSVVLGVVQEICTNCLFVVIYW